MNLFGKKKQEAPKLSDSIVALREAAGQLDKREQHLNKQVASTVEEVKKKLKAKDKRGAMFLLKRKKMLEKQVDQIYGKKANIEHQIMALESAASNKEVLHVMRKGKDALTNAVKETDIDKAGDVMADIQESIALADELGEAIAQPIGPVVDEDELLGELEEFESEMMDEQLLKNPVPVVAVKSQEKPGLVDDLPSAPSQKLKQVESAEDREAREMKELDALMNA